MSITLDYTKLPNASITPSFVLDTKPSCQIGLKAPDTFIKNVMFPILRTLSTTSSVSNYVFSCYKALAVMKPGAAPCKCTFTYLRKSRQYPDAFQMFSNYGINLSGLLLGFNCDTNTFYVPRKLHQFICKFDANQQSEYVRNLLYYHRFLFALAAASGSWRDEIIPPEAAPTFKISSEDLKTIIHLTEPITDTEDVNLDYISDDMTYGYVTFMSTPKGSELPLSLNTPSIPATGLAYNVLEANGKRYLAIVNRTFKPAAFYVIDPERKLIGTNMELQAYNTTSDGSEFIPLLAKLFLSQQDSGKANEFTVAHLSLATLLDKITKAKEFSFSSDTSGFECILDVLNTMAENYDPSLYNDAHGPDMKMLKSSIGTDLASEYETDEYAQSLYKQNQGYYDTFDLGSLTPLVKGIASKGDDQIYSMLFEGETGTGKSTAARVMFHKAGLPWISINCSTNIDEADMFGSMIPNPIKKSADDPEFVWQDGPATRAIRRGYGLIVEEGNGARPGVLLKLNSLLDEARQIELGNGEVLKAHPNFRIAFTSNIAYEGTNELNKAFVDRFDLVHKFEDIDKPTAIGIIKTRTGYADVTKIEKIYGVYEAVKKYSKESNLGLAVSIRRLMGIFTKGKLFKNALQAVKDMLLDHAFLQEPEHLAYFMNNVLPSFDLSFKI